MGKQSKREQRANRGADDRDPSERELACIREVARKRTSQARQEMRQRGALAAKQAADRVWKRLGVETPCTVHPPANACPVSDCWELWPGATAAELAEAKRIFESRSALESPPGRIDVRVDEPPPPPPPLPPLPPTPENWKPVDWMDTEHYKKLASGPNATPKLNAQLQALKVEGEPPKAGWCEEENGIRKPAVCYVAPEKGPIEGPAANCAGDDSERKRLGTALYKRIAASVPKTACPFRNVLQVGLQVHKKVMLMNIAALKGLVGKNTEDFVAEIGPMVDAVLSAEGIVAVKKQPDNPEMRDNGRMSDKARLPLGTAICHTRRARHILSDASARSRGRNGSSPCLLS